MRRCGLNTDDTQLYLSIPSVSKETVDSLNQCLEEVMGWVRVNKLTLNPDKREVLIVGPNSELPWLAGVALTPNQFAAWVCF